MENRYLRKEGENDFEYGLRLIEIICEENPKDLEWQDVIETLGLSIHRDTLRKASQTEFGGYNVAKYFKQKMLESTAQPNMTLDITINDINEKQRELQKERVKLQTEKLELNRWIREQARIEMYLERVDKAIETMQPIEIPQLNIYKNVSNRDAILNIADIHFGKETLIKGLKGEILNEYNEKVFEERMWKLLEKTIAIIEKENLTHLNLLMLGDLIDGILRASQLQSLQYGIVESVMRFSEFIANWINELSKYVYIDYYSVLGNHSQLRPLGSKNGEFAHENVEKIINWYLHSRLMNNQNVTVHLTDSEFAFFNVCGCNIMATHGEEKNLEQAVKDYMAIYNENINYLITGHLHSGYQNTASMNSNGDIDVIRIPSICGIDDFSMKLRKAASAGAKLLILQENEGKIAYDIKLQ